MHRRIALLAAPALTVSALACLAQAAPTPSYRVRTISVTTHVAAEGALGQTTCVVDADLFTPTSASRKHPAPALLTTNGFGGSKASVTNLARSFAAQGYVVLAYSGLGFGSDPQAHRRGSDCRITMDDRAHDGAAASQLVDVLGGIRKADDGTRIDYVRLDQVAHDGRHHRGDPRVAMIGGSYGGQVQFAAAAVDPRIDTIVPLVTWNDLAYSLSPNNAGLAPTTVTQRTPGAAKVQWNGQFLSLGLQAGALGSTTDVQTRVGACPNFSDNVCQALSRTSALGYADAAAQSTLRQSSVATYVDRIHVPVLLGQGETDALFPLREAIATYTALRAHHVPVRMVWQHWGHGQGPAWREYDDRHLGSSAEGRIIQDWLRYWLKDSGSRPPMDFAYYAPWRDAGNALNAFVHAPSYPLAGTTTLYASGTSLHPTTGVLSAGKTIMVAPPLAPMSFGEPSPTVDTGVYTDLPGATAVMSSLPLRHDVDVIGAPTARLRLSSATVRGTTPESMLVAFVKLYDTAPDGSVSVATRLVAPIRVGDLSKPVTVALPAMVHRFEKGHRMQLVVSLTDFSYKGNAQAHVVTLSTSAAAPTSLTLPGQLDLSAFPTGS